jgi:hypothetical protein
MRVSIISAFLFGFWLASPAVSLPNDAENIKLVTTGQVSNVDAKHKTFQFKFRLDQPSGFNRPVNRYPAGRRGGIGGRRGRIGGYPGRPGIPVPDDMKEVKVYVSEGTGFKDSSGALQFSDLKAGDRITLTATRKGHGDDLEAQVVHRN